jgi:hypothetical protein
MQRAKERSFIQAVVSPFASSGSKLSPQRRACAKLLATGGAMVESFGAPPSFPSQNRERRSVPRFNLIATAEITEPASEVHISGRISEISRKGCYLDVLNTLPVGTRLRLTISRDQGAFTADAKIIYVQEGMGMGIFFLDVDAEQLRILDNWLAELG